MTRLLAAAALACAAVLPATAHAERCVETGSHQYVCNDPRRTGCVYGSLGAEGQFAFFCPE